MTRKKAQAAPESASVPRSDPGPPPRYPHPPTGLLVVSPTARLIFEAGRVVDLDSARRQVLAISTMRQPPGVSQYKAEVLDWIERSAAYRQKNG